MVISETIFKNDELPLNSSLFIFKGRENLCMDTHYLYDEIQGEGDSKTTNYNKFIVPMMVPFELEHEYYYTEYPFPEEGVTRDDVRKVWIDMTKFKKNKPFTDNDYIYPILIGDKNEIRPEYNSIYSLCRLSDEEIQEYIIDESELTYTFEYQKSFSDTTDKVVKYDFISKHCRERETYSFKLNSLKVIPEDEPYFEMFKTLQTQMTEKTKFYVEYYPTVSYPNNYVEGDEGFDTVNPGRDNVIVYIPNIYSKEYVDGEMKITQNINVFAEEGKFIVFLNGTLVNYSVVKTDVPLTMSDGSKKYKRIQLENCSHLLRRREVNNELGNLSVRDDVVTIIYWDGVKYVKLNRDTAYSTAFYSPKLFIDRAKDEGGPVTMVVPTTFYYTAESNNKIKPRRLSDDNCLVVRDGKILRPEVDYKIRDERLLLNSFDEMGILDEELSKLVYDDEEGGIMYDFTRYRNQLSDLADSYINTEVLYFYDENNVEKVFIDRETRDILVNEPAIGSVLVKNWKPNDIFIGGTSRIDLEYQTTEPDGLDAIDESSPVYGQKRTRLSVPLTENVASSTEEWTMEEGENGVTLDIEARKIDLSIPDKYLDFLCSSRNVKSLRETIQNALTNRISYISRKVDKTGIERGRQYYIVMYADGTKNERYSESSIIMRRIDDSNQGFEIGSNDVDITDDNILDVVDVFDIDYIYLMSGCTQWSGTINDAIDDDDFFIPTSAINSYKNSYSILFAKLTNGKMCILITNGQMTVNDDKTARLFHICYDPNVVNTIGSYSNVGINDIITDKGLIYMLLTGQRDDSKYENYVSKIASVTAVKDEAIVTMTSTKSSVEWSIYIDDTFVEKLRSKFSLTSLEDITDVNSFIYRNRMKFIGDIHSIVLATSEFKFFQTENQSFALKIVYSEENGFDLSRIVFMNSGNSSSSTPRYHTVPLNRYDFVVDDTNDEIILIERSGWFSFGVDEIPLKTRSVYKFDFNFNNFERIGVIIDNTTYESSTLDKHNVLPIVRKEVIDSNLYNLELDTFNESDTGFMKAYNGKFDVIEGCRLLVDNATFIDKFISSGYIKSNGYVNPSDSALEMLNASQTSCFYYKSNNEMCLEAIIKKRSNIIDHKQFELVSHNELVNREKNNVVSIKKKLRQYLTDTSDDGSVLQLMSFYEGIASSEKDLNMFRKLLIQTFTDSNIVKYTIDNGVMNVNKSVKYNELLFSFIFLGNGESTILDYLRYTVDKKNSISESEFDSAFSSVSTYDELMEKIVEVCGDENIYCSKPDILDIITDMKNNEMVELGNLGISIYLNGRDRLSVRGEKLFIEDVDGNSFFIAESDILKGRYIPITDYVECVDRVDYETKKTIGIISSDYMKNILRGSIIKFYGNLNISNAQESSLLVTDEELHIEFPRTQYITYKMVFIEKPKGLSANRIPSFKKVCRNYDPFRDTNVYRLKVFSK